MLAFEPKFKLGDMVFNAASPKGSMEASPVVEINMDGMYYMLENGVKVDFMAEKWLEKADQASQVA